MLLGEEPPEREPSDPGPTEEPAMEISIDITHADLKDYLNDIFPTREQEGKEDAGS